MTRLLRKRGVPGAFMLAIGVGSAACGRPPFSGAESTSETGFGDADASATMTTTDTVTGVPPTTTTDTDTDDTGPSGACEPINLGNEVNISVTGNTQNEQDDFPVPCVGEGSAPDVLYQWRAPYAGTFLFDTFASPFDTALLLLSPGCTEVLECNDDAGEGMQSAIQRYLEADEVVLIQVDGYANEAGPYQLNISDTQSGEGQCPVAEIFEFPFEWYGSNQVGTNEFSSPCGGQGGRELGFFFVPPFDGVYYFESWGEVPTVLSLRFEACDGPEYACSSDPWMELELPAGIPVVLMVDSNEASSSEIGLWVDYFDAPPPPPPPPPPGQCPEGTLPSEPYVLVSGTTVGAPNSLGGSCGGESAPDHTYEFQAPIAGEYRVRTAGSQYDTLLHVRRDGCDGPELDCNDDTWQLLSQVTFVAEEGERFIITVDGFSQDSGPYQLEVALQ